MNNVVLKCKDCGSILVVNAKDLWHYVKCTHCDSYNIINLDEEFDQVEVVKEEDNDIEAIYRE